VASALVFASTLLLTPEIPCTDRGAPIVEAVGAPACRERALPALGVAAAAASQGEKPLLGLSRGPALDLERSPRRAVGKPELPAPRNPSLTKIYEALSSCRGSLPVETRWRIAQAIEEQSRRQGYDPLFVQAMIEIESTCSPTARSHKGAIGLIQLLPETARQVARAAGIQYVGPQTLLDPERNLEIGLLYLSQLDELLGDPHLAVAAYNLGPGRVAGKSQSFAKNFGYVRKILARYERLLAASTRT
jgi:soluble lytic murein transglycosylase-like protein